MKSYELLKKYFCEIKLKKDYHAKEKIITMSRLYCVHKQYYAYGNRCRSYNNITDLTFEDVCSYIIMSCFRK